MAVRLEDRKGSFAYLYLDKNKIKYMSK